MYTGFLWGNLKEREHLEDVGAEGRIIGWIFRKWDEGGWHGLDLSGSGYGQVSAICKCGNEPSDSIKCGEFLA